MTKREVISMILTGLLSIILGVSLLNPRVKLIEVKHEPEAIVIRDTINTIDTMYSVTTRTIYRDCTDTIHTNSTDTITETQWLTSTIRDSIYLTMLPFTYNSDDIYISGVVNDSTLIIKDFKINSPFSQTLRLSSIKKRKNLVELQLNNPALFQPLEVRVEVPRKRIKTKK